ncbi:MAG TPA: oxidative damage protection protein [Gammaproteobacteria bacterium]|jgi:Fe-S cluster biosynthesis and repair protein YggX|nr:oxidative damage protection protein [Gammaproteobacteria bacterium]
MSRQIHCAKLNKLAEGLASAPIGGELGQKIFETISQEAWQLWLARQTMIINENRLSMIDPKARAMLLTEMKKFLFEGGSEAPVGYIPPKN